MAVTSAAFRIPHAWLTPTNILAYSTNHHNVSRKYTSLRGPRNDSALPESGNTSEESHSVLIRMWKNITSSLNIPENQESTHTRFNGSIGTPELERSKETRTESFEPNTPPRREVGEQLSTAPDSKDLRGKPLQSFDDNDEGGHDDNDIDVLDHARRLKLDSETHEKHGGAYEEDLGDTIHQTHLLTTLKASTDSERQHYLDWLTNVSNTSLSSSDGTSDFDSDESTLCDELKWPPLGSDVGFTNDLIYPFRSLEPAAVQRLVDSYNAWSRGGGDAPSARSSQPIRVNRVPGPQIDGRQNGKKRTFEQAQLSPGADDVGPAIKKSRKQVSEGQVRLACHFQRHDPERYPACGIRTSGFDTIAHVKQHLKRSHQRNPNYCPRCGAAFATEAQKNDHILSAFASPCPERASPLPEGLSPEAAEALKRRVGKDDDLHEQWFSVWDVIFPGRPRPATCTLDLSGDIQVQTLALCSYFEAEGPGIVTSFLRDRGLVVGPPRDDATSAGEDAEILTRRAMGQAFRQIFKTWRCQSAQSSRILGPPDSMSISESSVQGSSAVPRTPAALPRDANLDASSINIATESDGDLLLGAHGMDGTAYTDVVREETGLSDLDCSQEIHWQLPASVGPPEICASMASRGHKRTNYETSDTDIDDVWEEWLRQHSI